MLLIAKIRERKAWIEEVKVAVAEHRATLEKRREDVKDLKDKTEVLLTFIDEKQQKMTHACEELFMHMEKLDYI